jgi:hypothetical protein
MGLRREKFKYDEASGVWRYSSSKYHAVVPGTPAAPFALALDAIDKALSHRDELTAQAHEVIASSLGWRQDPSLTKLEYLGFDVTRSPETIVVDLIDKYDLYATWWVEFFVSPAGDYRHVGLGRGTLGFVAKPWPRESGA